MTEENAHVQVRLVGHIGFSPAWAVEAITRKTEAAKDFMPAIPQYRAGSLAAHPAINLIEAKN
jgi:hypothetical protein